VLLLSRFEVEELLDLDELIDAVAGAMADLSSGRASVPHRVAALVDEHDGLLAAMPGYTPSARALVTKVMSLFPRIAGSGLPTHQGVIAVFDRDDGRPLGAARRHRDHRASHRCGLGARHAPARARGLSHDRHPRHGRAGARARPHGGART